MDTDLFGDQPAAQKTEEPETPDIVHARVERVERQDPFALFDGFSRLRAITYSTSLSAVLNVVRRVDRADIIIGSERTLGKSVALLEGASRAQRYGFTDAVADHKAFIENAIRPVLRGCGRDLLDRVANGTVTFRLLSGQPSHEKLFVLDGDAATRVVAGSANLSETAMRGRQRETFIVFDDAEAYRYYGDLVAADLNEAEPVAAGYLVQPTENGPDVAAKPVDLIETPGGKRLERGSVVEIPARSGTVRPDGKALKQASDLGRQLSDVSTPRDKAGRKVIDLHTFKQTLRAQRSQPINEDDREPAAVDVDVAEGTVHLDGELFHSEGNVPAVETAVEDARLLDRFFDGVTRFYGDADTTLEAYWTVLVWLWSSPFASMLRAAAARHNGDAKQYPVYAVLYGRESGGKTTFSRIAARAMFGVDQLLGQKYFTKARITGMRELARAMPLIVDDVTNKRFGEHAPELVKVDHEAEENRGGVLISTNKGVETVGPELRKRMIVAPVFAAAAETDGPPVGQQILNRVSTNLYRRFLDRLIPEVRDMLAVIEREPERPPDLMARASRVLSEELADCLGERPSWAREISMMDATRLRSSPILKQLQDIVEENPDAVNIRKRSDGERLLFVSFRGNTTQAEQFRRAMPSSINRDRFGDQVRIDLDALRHEYGIDLERHARGLLGRILRRR